MALGLGYGLPFVAQHGSNPYKTQWAAAQEGAKAAGATVEDENAGVGSCLVSRGQEAYTAGLPATPSLLIVPQFYKAGNLYQDVPPFVAEDSTMRFTVTRDTTARRVNSSGLIESVASGVPRIDWLGQSCPALLVEASGQNLAWHSETWAAGSNWLISNITRATGSTDAFKAPDGTFTANAMSPTSGNVVHGMDSNNSTLITYTSGTIYTQSVFLKAGTGAAGRYAQLTFGSPRFTQLGYANFDLQDGVVTLVTGTSADANRNARIENYGNGWYRCSFTATCNASGTTVGVATILITASGDTRAPSFAGTVTDVLYTWGAQVEASSIATTYIPTTTGSASRNADVISASGALVSGLIGQSQGCIYAEIDLRNFTASGRILTCSDNTSNERIMLQVGANRTLQAVVTTASADVCNISTASGQVNGVYKCALAYASGDFAFYVNGTQVGTDSSGSVPACTAVYLGKIGTSGTTNFLNDRIRAAALYTTRLSNSQLEQLTRL